MLPNRLRGLRTESSICPTRAAAPRRYTATVTAPWRPAAVLDEYIPLLHKFTCPLTDCLKVGGKGSEAHQLAYVPLRAILLDSLHVLELWGVFCLHLSHCDFTSKFRSFLKFPISLMGMLTPSVCVGQLTFFGRTLTENRLLSSANYVRTELPTRLAHRLRDMQTLPFVVVTNPHMSHVYDLYYKAFEKLRRVREIKTTEDNEKYCKVISETLQEHLTVIPRLAMGVLECQDLMRPEQIDRLMNTLLRAVSFTT